MNCPICLNEDDIECHTTSQTRQSYDCGACGASWEEDEAGEQLMADLDE